MPDTVKTERPDAAGTTRLCTAQNLRFKAYKRPYMGSDSAPVLTLLASGEYGVGPMTMFFEVIYGETNKYNLMERVPSGVFHLTNYPAASYSSDYGLPELAGTVTVVTQSGEHSVTVEAFE